MNGTEITGVILGAGAVAAAAVRVLDKIVEAIQAKRYGPDYNFQIDAWRREILEAIREQTNTTYQLRLEIREATHRILSALGVPRSAHNLPDDPAGFEQDQGGQ